MKDRSDENWDWLGKAWDREPRIGGKGHGDWRRSQGGGLGWRKRQIK